MNNEEEKYMVILEAHQGVATECPGNTYAAFNRAAEQGYPMIELDPNYTKDGKLVVLHDDTINRTARDEFGNKIEDPINIHEITYEEACKYDYGIRFAPEYKGETLPLLEKVFAFAEEHNIALKIDNKYEAFPDDIKDKLYAMIKETKAEIGLTCGKMDSIRKVMEINSDIPIHYDGPVEEEILKELSSITKKLTVWIPFQCKRTSWVTVPFASQALCALIKKYAALGVWIISSEEDYNEVCRQFSPDYVETDGAIKPEK
jgi:glycerophosphoryl diester phosphodiesterase